MAKRLKESSSNQLNKLTKDVYDFERLSYPSDNIGTDEVPSYVIFYINLPETSRLSRDHKNAKKIYSTSDELSGLTRGGRETVFSPLFSFDTPDVAQAALEIGFASSFNLTAKGIRRGAEGGAKAAVAIPIISTVASGVRKRAKFFRIAKAIALYMPDTIFQTYAQDYDALSVTQATGLAGMAQRGADESNSASRLEYIFEAAEGKGPGAGKFLSELGGLAAQRTGYVGAGFTDLLLRSSGLALNPQIEMVYKQTQNRQFTFDFKMQPRDPAESNNIKNIIRYFKMYSAPDLVNNTAGAYFEIPGQFDIEFMFKNEENKFIGKISTCVLQNIDVNYSSAGQFATFDDGSPVEINLQLRFIEVDTLTRGVFEDSSEDKASF